MRGRKGMPIIGARAGRLCWLGGFQADTVVRLSSREYDANAVE